MKGEIKSKYIEYVNHIDFPVVLYVYETNRVVAMNSYAREIIGNDCDDIRDLFEGKKFKLPKDVIEGGSKLVRNVDISTANTDSIKIDMDINVLSVDNVHFVLVLFEEAIKNKFTSCMNVRAMRVAWKYTSSSQVYMNEALKRDVCADEEKNNFNMDEYLEDSVLNKIESIKESIIDHGECQYNSIQMIVTRDKDSHFIKVNRMPIINSAGENIGILNIHNKILDKDSNRKLYDSVFQDVASKEEINEEKYNNDFNDEEFYELGKNVLIFKDILERLESDVIVYSKQDESIKYINKKTIEDFEGIGIGVNIYEFFIKYAIEKIDVGIIKSFKGIGKDENVDTVVRDGFNNRNLRLRVNTISWKEDNDSVVLVFTEAKDMEILESLQEKEQTQIKSLPDRIKFDFDVKDYIIKAIEDKRNGTLIMFQFKNFKEIKYNLGALYAEALIKQVEEEILQEDKLKKCTYRSRGVDFLVLLNKEEPNEIEEIILLLNNLFNKTRIINDKEIKCEINIGITLFPRDGFNARLLMKNVDFAIYEAERDANCNYKYYDGEK